MNIDDLIYFDEDTAYVDGVPFTGIAYEENALGNRIAESEFRNGIEEGWSAEWYPDGIAKRSEGEIRYGFAWGTYRVWYSNGLLAEETEYDDRGEPRVIRKWDNEGMLTSEIVR
ncbi:toxin-antitoxin system YwqK family antitoxin [Nocardia sp. NPDC056100]|uniref:toxin-antitoxin system YwqK family antitoxin n=1 Tax=Nocardia sp. NPDC056100 TaxID=3345712 RepID=UPI0035D9FF1E